mmetsp:Transcript_17688/g.38213  ORF Transcript_17688/g.38213 Transcript_17688/m.38213 type:complete len:134 (-) Transcript_17688:125-526(-)
MSMPQPRDRIITHLVLVQCRWTMISSLPNLDSKREVEESEPFISHSSRGRLVDRQPNRMTSATAARSSRGLLCPAKLRSTHRGGNPMTANGMVIVILWLSSSCGCHDCAAVSSKQTAILVCHNGDPISSLLMV